MCYGDILYITTIAKQIKTNDPNANITWAVADKYKSILELNPYVDHLWVFPIFSRHTTPADWKNVEQKVTAAKESNEYCEIYFPRIIGKDIYLFFDTLRNTNFRVYKKPITISKKPILYLGEDEINFVKEFAVKNNLQKFKQIVLFECSPSSNQSQLNVSFAKKLSLAITTVYPDVCFILSSAEKIDDKDLKIVDGSELTYRQNAEIAKYCTLLIGCSSGISWLTTSDYCKVLPTIQLLDSKSEIFASMHYDFELSNLNTDNLIEMIHYDIEKVKQCVISLFENGISVTKPKFHQIYRPSIYNLKHIIQSMIYQDFNYSAIKLFIKNWVLENDLNGNKVRINKLTLKVDIAKFYLKKYKILLYRKIKNNAVNS